MNAFFKSQFNYCPFIWICHSRDNDNKINRIQEINDKQSPFNALLEKDGSISVHRRNFKILATKMLKVSINLAPPQMHEIFI